MMMMMLQYQGLVHQRRAAAATGGASASSFVSMSSHFHFLFAAKAKATSALSALSLVSRRLSSSSSSSLSSFRYDAPWLDFDNSNSGNHASSPRIMNFINGKFETASTATAPAPAALTDDDDKGIIPIYNPSTNSFLSVIPELSSSNNNTAAAATERAIRAAKEAFPSWSNTPVQNRQRLLLEYAHLLHKKEVREEIA